MNSVATHQVIHSPVIREVDEKAHIARGHQRMYT